MRFFTDKDFNMETARPDSKRALKERLSTPAETEREDNSESNEASKLDMEMNYMIGSFMQDKSRFNKLQENTINSQFDQIESFQTTPFADGAKNQRRQDAKKSSFKTNISSNPTETALRLFRESNVKSSDEKLKTSSLRKSSNGER